ncbi:MAG: hypothetical protein QXR22_02955 [Acidilobaceae archaeon]
MPPNKLMPEFIKGIAISKPKRESWLIEELYDALIPLDESVIIEKTRFQGVLVILSDRLDARTISRAASKAEFSFMSRLIPALVVLVASSRSDIDNAITRLLDGLTRNNIRLIANLRGSGKNLYSKRELTSKIESLGFKVLSRASRVLVIESIDNIVVLSYGNTRRCGLNCILLSIA